MRSPVFHSNSYQPIPTCLSLSKATPSLQQPKNGASTSSAKRCGYSGQFVMTDLKNREAFEAAERASTYEWGFSSDIEQEFAPKGLSEDTVRYISAKKNEPNGCSNGASRPIAPG
jgi:hypothetical protein